MKITKYVDRFVNDNNYKITIMKDMVNVNNYEEIKDFSDTKIVIKSSTGITTIMGSNLIIAKMLDKEILVTGNIFSINF